MFVTEKVDLVVLDGLVAEYLDWLVSIGLYDRMHKDSFGQGVAFAQGGQFHADAYFIRAAVHSYLIRHDVEGF